MSVSIVGVDPGLNGGLAFVWESYPDINQIAVSMECMPMPVIETTKGKKVRHEIDANRVVDILKAWKPDVVVVESVHAMPKQGVASSFRFGVVFGQIRGILAGLGMGYVLVTPQAWMNKILAGYAKNGKGKASIQYVKQRWPNVNLLATPRSRVPHDGMADAICIAEYGRQL